MKLGVDFGTTRTIVAYADRGNYPIVSFFDGAGDAHDWFPSVVAERAGVLHFGFDALAVAERDPSYTLVRSFKRFLSDSHAVPGKEVPLGSTSIALGDLITQFFLALKEAIRTRSNLRTRRSSKDPLRTVIAVPANAHGAQRFVTLDAFRRAGFEPSAMLNEPSAAGFEYTHRHRDTLTSKRDHVVIYDLGGGTFDASLVRMRARRHEVLGTAGINQLGGDDFDAVLGALVCDIAKLDGGALAPLVRERLIDQCRDAKERLNPSSKKIVIDLEQALSRPGAGEVTVPVAAFYEACGPLVARSVEAMAPLMARLEGANREEGEGTDGSATSDELAGVYVVGGASELPIVARALRSRFGRRVHRSPYPSAAIAIGLAIACDEEAGFELADKYARTFGVFRESGGGSEITFDPIFTSDTPIPEHHARITCKRDYRAAHNVGHYRFFECAAVSEDGHPQGDMTMTGDVLFPFDVRLGEASDLSRVPVERLDGGPHVEEEYALDEHGIVAITIRDVDRGYQRVFRLGA